MWYVTLYKMEIRNHVLAFQNYQNLCDIITKETKQANEKASH